LVVVAGIQIVVLVVVEVVGIVAETIAVVVVGNTLVAVVVEAAGIDPIVVVAVQLEPVGKAAAGLASGTIVAVQNKRGHLDRRSDFANNMPGQEIYLEWREPKQYHQNDCDHPTSRQPRQPNEILPVPVVVESLTAN
jgi:hypothetical protein